MDSQVIQATIAQVKQATGLDVRYAPGGSGGGASFQVFQGGQWKATTPALAQVCNDILDDVAQNQAAVKAQAAHSATQSRAITSALRAIAPNSYRPILRRGTQAYRSAQAAQAAGYNPGLFGRIGAGIGAGAGIGYDTGGFVGGGFGAIGGAIGGAFGLTGGAIGGSVGAAVGLAAGHVFSLAMGVIGTASKLAAAGLTTLAGALGLAIRSATQFGQSVLTLAQKTGLSYSAAAGAIFTGKGFGIGSHEISTQNSWLQGMKSRLYGGDGSGSLEDIGAFRNFYRRLSGQGPGGLLMAQRIAENTGKSGYIGTAMLPNDLYQQQVGRIQAIGKGFNINPDTLARATQNWSLFMSTIDTGLSALATKVGVEVLPKIMPVLDKAINWLGSNAGRVSDLIVQGVQAGWDFLKKFAVFLYAQVPPALAQAGLSVLQFIKSIRDGATALWDQVGASPIGKALGIGGSGGSTGGVPGSPVGVATADASTGPGGVPSGGGAWNTVSGWGKAALRVGAAYLGGRVALGLLSGSGGNIGKSIVSSPLGRIIGAGAVIGGGYYEALRHADNPLLWPVLGAAGVVAGKMFYRDAPSTLDILRHATGAVASKGLSAGLSAVGLGVSSGGWNGSGAASADTTRPPDRLDAAISWMQGYAKDLGKPQDRAAYLERQIALLQDIAKNTGQMASQAPPATPEEIASLLRTRGRYEARDRMRASYNVAN